MKTSLRKLNTKIIKFKHLKSFVGPPLIFIELKAFVRYRNQLSSTCDQKKNYKKNTLALCICLSIFHYSSHREPHQKNGITYKISDWWQQRQNTLNPFPLTLSYWINVQCWHNEYHGVINHNYFVILFVRNHWSAWNRHHHRHTVCVTVSEGYTWL